jgi:hypothetical protein
MAMKKASKKMSTPKKAAAKSSDSKSFVHGA